MIKLSISLLCILLSANAFCQDTVQYRVVGDHFELTAKGEKLIEELAAMHRKEIRERSAELINALERLKK